MITESAHLGPSQLEALRQQARFVLTHEIGIQPVSNVDELSQQLDFLNLKQMYLYSPEFASWELTDQEIVTSGRTELVSLKKWFERVMQSTQNESDRWFFSSAQYLVEVLLAATEVSQIGCVFTLQDTFLDACRSFPANLTEEERAIEQGVLYLFCDWLLKNLRQNFQAQNKED